MPTHAQKSTGPHSVKLSNWIQAAPFEELVNMDIKEASEGKAILSMPFFYEYSQGAGIMHGGAITALADTALAMAIKSLLPENTHFGTTALEVKFLRAVVQGEVNAVAVIVSYIERDLVGQVTVSDLDNKEIMTATANFRIARKQTVEVARLLEKSQF